MGVIDVNCLALNGTRLVGLSLAMPESDYFKNNSNQTAVILVESSVANPATLTDLRSLSVRSVWKRNLSSLQYNDMEFACHIDPVTGIFSAVHSSNYVVAGIQGLSQPAGGFQYNPSTDTWSDITLSLDYKWDGNPQTSFTIFTWPNTTTLYQATIGNSSAINIGVLDPGSTSGGNSTLSNYFSWTLDSSLYGFPRQLAYGNGVIYQIGSVITNTNTGAQDVMIVSIPLTEDPSTFVPPKNPAAVSSPSLDQCGPGLSTASTTFYGDTLYLFCSNYTLNQDNTYPGDGNNGGFLFKFPEGGNLTGIFNTLLDIRFEFLGPFHAMPRGGNENDLWCPSLDSVQIITVGLNDNNFGNVSTGQGLNGVSISYGAPGSIHGPNYKAIVGGSVAGGVVVLLLIFFAVRRWFWPKWRDVYWPPRRDRIKAKLLEILTKDEHASGEYGDTRVLQHDGDSEHKVEEISMNSFEMYGQGKILVTDDMDLSEHIVDINSAYMGGLMLQNHPRPNVVTVLEDSGSASPGPSQSRPTQLYSLQQGEDTDRAIRGPQAIVMGPTMEEEQPLSAAEGSGVGRSYSSRSSRRRRKAEEAAEEAAGEAAGEAAETVLPTYHDALSPPPSTTHVIEPPSAPPNPARNSPESPP